jgi:hypothetical protein
MAPQPYARPPITEAIIQINFAGLTAAGDDLAKVNGIFARLYPQHQEIRQCYTLHRVTHI